MQAGQPRWAIAFNSDGPGKSNEPTKNRRKRYFRFWPKADFLSRAIFCDDAASGARLNVSAETETPRQTTILLEQAIETERRRLLHVHGVLRCLYEVLLYADGEDAVLYAEAAHLASIMVDESVTQLDSTRIKSLIDALKMESGGRGGEGFMVREAPPPPYLLS